MSTAGGVTKWGGTFVPQKRYRGVRLFTVLNVNSPAVKGQCTNCKCQFILRLVVPLINVSYLRLCDCMIWHVSK